MVQTAAQIVKADIFIDASFFQSETSLSQVIMLSLDVTFLSGNYAVGLMCFHLSTVDCYLSSACDGNVM